MLLLIVGERGRYVDQQYLAALLGCETVPGGASETIALLRAEATSSLRAVLHVAARAGPEVLDEAGVPGGLQVPVVEAMLAGGPAEELVAVSAVVSAVRRALAGFARERLGVAELQVPDEAPAPDAAAPRGGEPIAPLDVVRVEPLDVGPAEPLDAPVELPDAARFAPLGAARAELPDE